MTNAVQPMSHARSASSGTGFIGRIGRPLTRLLPSALIYTVILIGIITVMKYAGGPVDYVGPDNDDGMRLVEVRDFLNGQGWFDLMQYRLGLDDGTLMHWSRLIDLPIAALIRFFGLFLGYDAAEAAALMVWPLLLVFPAMLAIGLAGLRVGGTAGMHLCFCLAGMAIYADDRFAPGAIDHHNVQFVLVAIITAMLFDEKQRAWNYMVTGASAALAIAIGAETTPLIAVYCLTVASLWAWEGEAFALAAKAFGLSLAVAISILFFATVPPQHYSTVTCDNLSLGFYSLATIGGGLLLSAAVFASRLDRAWRFVVLGVIGAAVFGSALVIAPQCLRNPLADLDPMLVEIWLRNVSEAQSLLAIIRTEPFSVGSFYAPGLFAIAVCIFRSVQGDRVPVHLVLLALLAVSWAVALIQVRGAVFANLLSILPLALLIIDVRRMSNGDSENAAAALVYIVTVLASVPAVWAVGGAFVEMQVNKTRNAGKMESLSCTSKQALAPLSGLPAGLVSASPEMGVPILRYTVNRVLSAPYHRNQGGLLTEMHIGLAEPQEAEAFLKGVGVTVLAFCPEDLQTKQIARLKPDGLYGQLGKGNVPTYLHPLPKAVDSGVQFFRYGATSN